MLYSHSIENYEEIKQWLKGPESPPPVRYLATIHLESDFSRNQIQKMKEDIRSWAPLKNILELQQEDGGFPITQKGKPGIPTFSALTLMNKCGMDIEDEEVRKALDYLEARHSVEGVISWNSGGSGILPCYAGVTASHISRMTGAKNRIVEGVANWIIKYQRFDHKDERSGGKEEWPYRGPSNFGCWQSVSCYHGVVASLALLSSIPMDLRTPEIKDSIKKALRYLEIHKVFRKTATGEQMFRHLTNFFVFGQWRMHLLDILEAIIDADKEIVGAEWLEDTFEEIKKHSIEGRIIHKTDYRTFLKDPAELEPLGGPSYFLTLQWVKILKKVEAITATP